MLSSNLSTRSQISFAPHGRLTQLDVQNPVLPSGFASSVMHTAPAHCEASVHSRCRATVER
jgi:hypothetical protein